MQEKIEKRLFKGKIVIIYGARQVGKTTLVKKIITKYPENSKYLNCELLSVRNSLEVVEAEKLKTFLGEVKLVVLDEAQKIKDIGLILKIMADTYPEIQIIATGSSSFELANKISEPLTGRAVRFFLYPFSFAEIKNEYDLFTIQSKLENILRFGLYPEVFLSGSDDLSKERLDEIASNYLYKDILMFEGLKKSRMIIDLLKLLALQLGREVSYNELAGKLGINRKTVENYIDILEKSFIVFRLRAFSRNLRKEISKSFKVYFYDLGIRNSLLQNYNNLDMRDDVGALWENFCIVERMKYNSSQQNLLNTYFWRTYTQKEIDYIEEKEGQIIGYEFKWGQAGKKYTAPKEFIQSYKARVHKIDRNNYWEFF